LPPVSESEKGLSRRELLKRAGLTGVALVGSVRLQPDLEVRLKADTTEVLTTEVLTTEVLTSAEADILDAVCARLIPSDENGPGAKEARASRYIDRALAGFLKPSRQAYTTGLADIDRRAMQMRGMPFATLAPADQDAVLH